MMPLRPASPLQPSLPGQAPADPGFQAAGDLERPQDGGQLAGLAGRVSGAVPGPVAAGGAARVGYPVRDLVLVDGSFHGVLLSGGPGGAGARPGTKRVARPGSGVLRLRCALLLGQPVQERLPLRGYLHRLALRLLVLTLSGLLVLRLGGLLLVLRLGGLLLVLRLGGGIDPGLGCLLDLGCLPAWRRPGLRLCRLLVLRGVLVLRLTLLVTLRRALRVLRCVLINLLAGLVLELLRLVLLVSRGTLLVLLCLLFRNLLLLDRVLAVRGALRPAVDHGPLLGRVHAGDGALAREGDLDPGAALGDQVAVSVRRHPGLGHGPGQFFLGLPLDVPGGTAIGEQLGGLDEQRDDHVPLD